MNVSDLQIVKGYVQALPRVSGHEEGARVAVITEDGASYHVAHKGAGTGLAANINAHVEVTGSVEPWSGGEEEAPDEARLQLTVKSFRLTDGFDDPWYDDDVDGR